VNRGYPLRYKTTHLPEAIAPTLPNLLKCPPNPSIHVHEIQKSMITKSGAGRPEESTSH
jgi:hypothetical protein